MTPVINAAEVAAFFAPAAEDQTKRVAGVAVEQELFEEHYQKQNLRWAGKLLSDIEEHAATALFNRYQYRIKKGHKPVGVNAWLRTSVASIKEHAARFPLPLRMVANELGRANVAREWSNRCTTIIQELTADFTQQVNAQSLLVAAMAPANQWGISPLLPVFDGPQTDRQLDMAAAALARLQDADWWERQITRAWRQYAEHVAILVGRVRRGVSAYVSNKALQAHQQRKRAGMAWLKTMYAINPDLELEIPLVDAVKASVANPEIRRMELMVRMRGFEDLAEEEGLVGEFYTWTAPSKYHAWTVVDNKRRQRNDEKLSDWVKTIQNKKYQGYTPRQTQQYLVDQWSKARAKLDRLGIRRFGFRVVEPHHDGTPHWHMLIFVKPEQREKLREVMQAYACEHDTDELKNGTSARFDYKEINSELGSATGYIAKYISKNIDGFNVDWDDEAQEAANTSVSAVSAWASLWRIRQFQQIGGPAVSVWRELRRIREASRNPVIESARHAADTGKWAQFVTAMGGIDAARKDHLIQLNHIIKPEANKYGEDISRLVGLRTAPISISVNGVVSGVMAGNIEYVQTKVEGWELSRFGLAEHREVSFGERSELPLSSGSCAPWSSDNKCTQRSGLAENDPLDRQMAMLGLDNQDKKRLLGGSIIQIDGLYIRIRNGALLTSRERPGTNGEYDDLDRDFNYLKTGAPYWRKRILGELFTGAVPVDQWFKAVPAKELGPVMMHADHLLEEERQLNPKTYQEDALLVMLHEFIEDTIDDPEFRSAYLE